MTVNEALHIVSVGTVTPEQWNAAPTSGKKSFLNKQEQAIPIHLQAGAINKEMAEDKRKALKVLQENLLQEEKSEI